MSVFGGEFGPGESSGKEVEGLRGFRGAPDLQLEVEMGSVTEDVT